METLLINIPDDKSALVKQLLKELRVTIGNVAKSKPNKINKVPNALTINTIEDARKGIDLAEPIENVNDFINSL